MIARDQTLTIRIANEEKTMLYALADRDGVSASDVLRVFIRRAHAEAFGATPKAKPRASGGRRGA